jgi:hypothetical protein
MLATSSAPLKKYAKYTFFAKNRHSVYLSLIIIIEIGGLL